jgi:hypothetical protein
MKLKEKFKMIFKTALISFLFLFQSNVFAQETEVVLNSSPGITQNTFFYYNFGRVTPGMSTFTRYSVKNVGTSTLQFLRASISGGFDFSAYHTCSKGLLPQQSCWFEIRYWPQFEGFQTARFVINFDQSNNIIVDVAGQAVH